MQLFDMNTQEGRDALAAYEQKREAMLNKGQQLYATIKRSSKYAGQAGEEEMFPVRVMPTQLCGEWNVKGGPGGQYRLEDLSLFIVEENVRQRIA